MNQLNKSLAFPAILMTLFILAMSIISPTASQLIANTAMNWLTHYLGWAVELAGFACLAFLLWLAFSRFGQIKLGDTAPSFSNKTYAGMIFSAGVGASLIFWGIGEPIYYMQAPPLFAEKGSFTADAWLTTYSIFHWGPTGWAIYCLPALPFSYMFYNRKQRKLKLSTLCSDVIGEKRAKGKTGYLIDLSAILATLATFASSLALSTGLLAQGIAEFLHVKNGLAVQASVIFSFIIVLFIIMRIGFKKGIAKVSDCSLILTFLLVVFIIIVGNGQFILANFVDSLGVMLDSYFRMSFWNDPVQQSGFPQGWTMYYWAWYSAFILMMGLFITRISKGRTIKEVILYTITMGSLGCGVIISTFGGYAVGGDLLGDLNLQAWMQQGDINFTVIQVIKSLPLQPLTLFVFLLVEFSLMLTTMSSASVAVAMATTTELDLNGDPDTNVKLLWACGIGLISFSVFLVGGGIDTIKALCVIVGFPMFILYGILAKAFMGWLNEDYPQTVPLKQT